MMKTQKRMIPRGIRNKNPLNIRRTSIKWKGMAGRQTDPAFCQFTEMSFGLRAAFIVLHTYVTRYHMTTLQQVISRWAPPLENDPVMYLSYVCLRTGQAPREPLPPMTADSAFWPLLVEAMAEEECGKDVMARGLLSHSQVMAVWRDLTK